MFKNRFLFVLGVVSVLLVSLAASGFATPPSPSNRTAAGEQAVNISNWTWMVPPSAVTITASDYYQRHPELSTLNGNTAGNFAIEHSNWTWSVAPSAVTIVASDYYQRHPELSAAAK